MTAGSRNFLVALGLLAAVFGAAGGWLLATTARLEGEKRDARAQRERWAELEAEASISESPKPAVEVERASREELERLRTEVPALAAELNRRKDALAAEMEKRKSEFAANNAPKKPAAPSRAPGPWTNAGRAQPEATFQSVLWAIDGGETEALSKMIAFDGEAQAEAERFLAALPAAERASYGDARSLVASMMAAEISPNATSMQVVAQKPLSNGELQVSVQLATANPSAKPRTANLRFRQADGGWQLLVPAKVIEGYRYLIAAPATQP